MFITARTTLRAYGPADLPLLLALVNNPLIQSTLISDPIVPRNHRFAQKLEEIANEALLYVIIEATDKPNGPVVIGAASITTVNIKNRDVSFGIGLIPDVWNQGYATEVTRFLVDHAFNNLGVHRISLGVLDNNPGAIQAYKKVYVEMLWRSLTTNGFQWLCRGGQETQGQLLRWKMAR